MTMHRYTATLLIVFLLAAIFGLFISFGSMHHDAGCPFSQGEVVLCGPLEHVGHWQSAFVAVVAVITGFLVVLATSSLLVPSIQKSCTAQNHRRTPFRPSVMQELFAGGILNPKAP